jgi:hypothetical protein
VLDSSDTDSDKEDITYEELHQQEEDIKSERQRDLSEAVREHISLSNLSTPNLWDLWFHGDKSRSDAVVPPYRCIHDDYFTSSIRKARSVIDKLLREVPALKVLKEGQCIADLSDRKGKKLRDDAIKNAYDRAQRIRKTLNKELTQTTPYVTMSFTTFYQYVNVDPLIKSLEAEEGHLLHDDGLE